MDGSETVPAVAGGRARDAAAWLVERREILLWWALGRGLVLATAALVEALGRPRGIVGLAPLPRPLGLLGAWDGRWYRIVAERGYLLVPGRQSDPAFFPLYPILVRGLESLGVPGGVAGPLLSNVVFLVALLALAELGAVFLPRRDATRAAVYAAVFPMGFVFSMAYPEALVLALVALAGLLALRGRWLGAAVFAAGASLARPEGVFVALPLVLLAWQRRGELDPATRGRALAAALAGPAALVTFPLYLWLTLGDAHAWTRAETAWGRSFRPGGVVQAFERLGPGVAHDAWLVRDVAFCVVSLALLAAAARAVPAGWTAAGALIVLLPLGSGSFESEARFGLLVLPVYWGLARIGRSPTANAAIVMVSLALLVAGTATIPLQYP